VLLGKNARIYIDHDQIDLSSKLGIVIWLQLSDIRQVSDLTGMSMRIIFYPFVTPELRQVWDGYFFSSAGNPTGTRYFIIIIILGCEQIKMCLFYYINYDLL
jgi:hypothetical protein